jgi:type II secretory pathway pseudopilin PulG
MKRGKWQFGMRTLLLVVTVVSLLASSIAFWWTQATYKQAEEQVVRLFVIELNIGEFHRVSGRIPTEKEGLAVMTMIPSGPPAKGRMYLDPATAVDVWGNEIVYVVTDSTKADGFDLRSLGPNGIDDGVAQGDISLRDGYNLDYYQAADLRTALGWLALGLFAYCLVIVKYVASRRDRRTREGVTSGSISSEATS